MSDLAGFLSDYRTMNRRVAVMDSATEGRIGLSFIQAAMLQLITEGADRPHLLAGKFAASSQTITGVLDRLERAGLVERQHQTAGDRRAVVIKLTKGGETVATILQETLAEALAEGRKIL